MDRIYFYIMSVCPAHKRITDEEKLYSTYDSVVILEMNSYLANIMQCIYDALTRDNE